MRNTAVNEINRLAGTDDKICLMTGDLGFGVLDSFIKDHPDRFINAGISEQGMTAIAAGMALEGMTVFTYSIGNFPSLRCLEQIRNDICYHNANVKIIALGSGFAYGQLGMSHHATEDIGAMRSLPNMHIFSPADPLETTAAVRMAYETPGPCYIRLGKGGEKNLRERKIESLLCAQELVAQSEINILSTGAVTAEAVRATELLRERGITAGVFSFPVLKPIDEASINRIAALSKMIFTLEEHNVAGGFGTLIADALIKKGGYIPPVHKLGLQDVFPSIVGDAAFLRNYYGFSAEKIAVAVESAMGSEMK